MCARVVGPARACWSDANDVSCHVRESAFTGPRAAESWLQPVAYFAGAWKWDAAAIQQQQRFVLELAKPGSGAGG